MNSANTITLITLLLVAVTHGLNQNDYQQQLYQNYDQRQKIFSESEAPNIFPTTASPLSNPNKSPEYRDFLKELYRFDRDKSPTTFQVIQHQPPTASLIQVQPYQQPIQPQPQPQHQQSIQYVPYQTQQSSPQIIHQQQQPSPYIQQHQIVRRATDNNDGRQIIFRPLFSYTQQHKKPYRKLTKAEYRKKYLEYFNY